MPAKSNFLQRQSQSGNWIEEAPDEFLCSLLGDIAPEISAIMAFVKAYFDESDRSNAGGCDIFAVAGVVFTRKAVDRFIYKWRKMLGPVNCFHMADLAARQGEFKGLSEVEAGTLLKEAVAILNRYRLAVVACSCRVSDFEALKRVRFRGFDSPYAICAESCMIQLGSWLNSQKNSPEVAYFFEAGHRHASDAQWLLARISEHEVIERAYRYRSYKFLKKEDAVPLQTADLVAWEYAKFQDETAHRSERKARASYVALEGADKDSFLVRHRDKAALQELMDVIQLAAEIPEPGSSTP